VKDPAILVVEDNAVYGGVVVAGLRRGGLDVQVVARGDDALDKMRQSRPDLVLLDLALPGVSGLGILAEMRTDPALCDVPVVVLTTYTGRSMEAEARHRGAARFLLKTDVGLDDIARIVREVLDQQPAPVGPRPGGPAT
jgi:CheY-like chemotaxis protein